MSTAQRLIFEVLDARAPVRHDELLALVLAKAGRDYPESVVTYGQVVGALRHLRERGYVSETNGYCERATRESARTA